MWNPVPFLVYLNMDNNSYTSTKKHDKAQQVYKISISQFSQKYPLLEQMGNLGPIWHKIMQP